MVTMMTMEMMSITTRMPMPMPRVAGGAMTVPSVGMADMTVMPMSVSALSTSDAPAMQSGEKAQHSHHRDEARRTGHGFLRRVSEVIAAANSNDFLIPGKADLQALLIHRGIAGRDRLVHCV